MTLFTENGLLNGVVGKTAGFAQRKPIVFSLILMAVSAFFLYQSSRSMIPPPEVVTRHRFEVLESVIKDSLQKNPDQEVELKRLVANNPGKMLDGWNHAIEYRRVGPGMHRLTSYGKDGIPGHQPDMIHHFNL
jgi:hypothetical protein